MKKLTDEERARRKAARQKRWYDQKRANGTLDDYYKSKYQTYKDYTKKKVKEYYLSNREDILSKQNAYFRTTEGYIKHMLNRAKARSSKCGVPFELTAADIIIPAECPALGIPIEIGKSKTHDGSPSLDRVKPHLGYVKGNIVVVSHKANRIKNNGTIEELKKVYEFYEQNDSF